ncbi:MAG TPA: UpxY family transcription antiterminator [Flavisolibacter sp.]|nr:UpxY family transcription antiterminator [Flavisolibacter sp.]
MNSEKKWYAVYTRPRWEKKVSELLTRKKVDNFCPLNKVVRQWADRKKTIQEPLFTSYVFVHATEAEHLAIKQTDGILNFVYWLGRPALIRNEEIDAIRYFLGEHEDVRLEKINVNVSDRVRIVDGPLSEREGNVVEVKSKSVKVMLPSLGYAMTAEVRKERVTVIDPYTTNATKNYIRHANFI